MAALGPVADPMPVDPRPAMNVTGSVSLDKDDKDVNNTGSQDNTTRPVDPVDPTMPVDPRPAMNGTGSQDNVTRSVSLDKDDRDMNGTVSQDNVAHTVSLNKDDKDMNNTGSQDNAARSVSLDKDDKNVNGTGSQDNVARSVSLDKDDKDMNNTGSQDKMTHSVSLDKDGKDNTDDKDDIPKRERCTGEVSKWGKQEQEFCCTTLNIGCGTAPLFSCNTTDVPATQWSANQSEFCCLRHTVGCAAVTHTLFDCAWSDSTAPWSHEQREYCCEVENVRCPDQTAQDKTTEEARCEAAATAGTLQDSTACCRDFGVGCAAPSDFNCSAGNLASWTDAKQFFCCREKDVCAMRCNRADIAAGDVTASQAAFCCDSKGLGCSANTTATQTQRDVDAATKDATKHKRALRLVVKEAVEDLLENPKKMLRRLRWAILGASALLQAKPSRLIVTAMGGLLPNGSVPTGASKFTLNVHRSWNEELNAEETALISTLTLTINTNRGADVLQSASADGSFVEYTVQDGSEGTVEAAVGEIEGKVEGGSLSGSGQGKDVMVFGSMGTKGEKTEKTEEEVSAKTWLTALVSIVGALCAGGVVAAVVVQRRQEKNAGDSSNAISEMHGADNEALYAAASAEAGQMVL